MDLWTLARRVRGAGTLAVVLLLGACGGGGGNGGGSQTPPAAVNQPPIANAGPDRSEFGARRVELDAASGSTDDHGLASSSWTQVAGPSVTLGAASVSLNATFTTPVVAADTVLTFSLTVTDDQGATSAPDTVDITVLPIPPVVTISGDILYESVPQGLPGAGLNYSGQGYVGIGDVLVEVLNATTQSVIASGSFPGEFSFDVPATTDLRLRATAILSRQAPAPLPHWQISVRDLDASGTPIGGVYAFTGPVFNSGSGGRQTLQIPSGWNTSGQLVGARSAAPFAILDAVRPALTQALSTSPKPDLPPLFIDWSPSNVGGDTFFQSNPGGTSWIRLAGEADVDTDEYDPAVIRHEFGHFILDSVSRDDSIGGAHSIIDRVDMRVALSEGFATAYGALVSHNSSYLDSFGVGQADSGFFDVAADIQQNEGWFTEASVHEVLWSLGDIDSVWTVINGPVRTADAMVSPFVLFAAYRQQRPDRAAELSLLLQGEGIVGATIDPYGSTEVNDASSQDVLPVYTPISLGDTVHVRSTNEFGTVNKLSTHRFLRLNVPAAGNVRFRATAAAGRDPDMVVFRRGIPLSPGSGPANEDFSLMLPPGDYVLDVYDCGNAGCNSNVTPAPVDITVSVTTS